MEGFCPHCTNCCPKLTFHLTRVPPVYGCHMELLILLEKTQPINLAGIIPNRCIRNAGKDRLKEPFQRSFFNYYIRVQKNEDATGNLGSPKISGGCRIMMCRRA